VEAILVAPANQDSLSKPLAELAAKGVKIIAVDTFISDQYPFVGTNQKAAGEAAGKFLAGLIQEGDEVSVLRHTQQNVASGEREAGAIAKLQEAKPGIKLHSEIYSGSEPGLEGEKAALLLNKYPGTKAIFSSSTPSTMAMLHELVKRDLAGKIKFVGCGFDLNDEVINALEAGHLDAWIAQLPGLMGSKGVEAALAAIADKPVAPRIDVEIRVITKADLKDPAILALKH
jgi:ribose transport system substrate-binding protein